MSKTGKKKSYDMTKVDEKYPKARRPVCGLSHASRERIYKIYSIYTTKPSRHRHSVSKTTSTCCRSTVFIYIYIHIPRNKIGNFPLFTTTYQCTNRSYHGRYSSVLWSCTGVHAIHLGVVFIILELFQTNRYKKMFMTFFSTEYESCLGAFCCVYSMTKVKHRSPACKKCTYIAQTELNKNNLMII